MTSLRGKPKQLVRKRNLAKDCLRTATLVFNAATFQSLILGKPLLKKVRAPHTLNFVSLVRNKAKTNVLKQLGEFF